MNNTRKLVESFNIKDWYDLWLRKELYSLFVDRQVEHQIKCIKWELDELLQWIEKWDKENISEEMSDVIYNTIQLLQSLLKKWLVDENDIANSGKKQKEKIFIRQPFLKTQEKPESFQQEHNLFIENKKTWKKQQN